MTKGFFSLRLMSLPVLWQAVAVTLIGMGGAVASLGVAAATAGAAANSPVIELAVGGQKPLATAHPLTRVAVGDPSVADVLVLKGTGSASGGMLLVGRGAGTTDVMLWERGVSEPITYTINVTSPAANALLDSETPAVRTFGDAALVSGSTPTMESHQRGIAAAQASLASKKTSTRRGGTGAAQASAAQGGDAADSLGGSASKNGTVLDTSTVATRPVVQVDVKVVEFSKAVLKEAGFNLFKQSNSFAFGTFSPSSLTSYTGGGTTSFTANTASPISGAFNLLMNWGSRGVFANLSLLESNNLARVLAEPTLVALSGQSASFLAGGEIPIPVPQSLGTISIEYKPYGIGLTLTPTVLGAQRIALKVAPEASQLDFAHAVTINGISVPAITTRRADTTVELGDGESFVIGGLIDRETASNVDKVPILGDLPIIGAFFKTLQYSQNDRELVIIVTPHLVAPIAKGATLPSTPGEQSEQRDGPVWRSFVGGVASSEDVPGFSK
jgi:pilus assembly protein CpaC